jgi:hypothetical protein
MGTQPARIGSFQPTKRGKIGYRWTGHPEFYFGSNIETVFSQLEFGLQIPFGLKRGCKDPSVWHAGTMDEWFLPDILTE